MTYNATYNARSVFKTFFFKTQLGREDETVFKSLYKEGIESCQASKCGELLTMMILKCWPKPQDGTELSSLGVLRHILSWKLWPGYFEFFGKLDKNDL